MYIIDFEYDGEMLSDHGAIIGGINTSSQENTPLGMTLTANTITNNDVNYMVSTQYDEVLTRNFELIKNPCYTDGSQQEMYFTDEEIYEIATWLEKKQYKKFKPIYDDNSFSDLVVYGIFNIEAVKLNGNVIGFSATITTNAPYAFGDEVEITSVLNSSAISFNVYNSSQEPGYLYPDKVVVKCNEGGKIALINTTDKLDPLRKTVVENCIAGETITFDCKNRIITSNKTHEGLYNDFNYDFPRLVSEYNNPENHFEIYDYNDSIKDMEVSMRFSPIRKVGVI